MSITNKSIQLPPPVLDNLKSLGRRTAAARKIQSLRQEDLASMAGISRSTVVEIEKGSPFVSMGSYMAALWALGIMSEVLPTGMNEEETRLLSSELPKRVRHG